MHLFYLVSIFLLHDLSFCKPGVPGRASSSINTKGQEGHLLLFSRPQHLQSDSSTRAQRQAPPELKFLRSNSTYTINKRVPTPCPWGWSTETSPTLTTLHQSHPLRPEHTRPTQRHVQSTTRPSRIHPPQKYRPPLRVRLPASPACRSSLRSPVSARPATKLTRQQHHHASLASSNKSLLRGPGQASRSRE